MIIFSPGPANISERVRRSLLEPDICHRGEEFQRILDQVRRQVCSACGAAGGYESVIFTGSGTAAIEASIATLKGMTKKLLIIANGIYGERAYDIARIHRLTVQKINFPDNALPDLSRIEQAIKRYRSRALYLVHHETTTGLLNPLKKIGYLAKKHKLLFMVDGVSSIASEELKLKDWGIDVIIGSANKGIRSVAGLSFVVLSKRFIGNLEKVKKGNAYYLDLREHLKRERQGQTPFTPAVQSFYAFGEALSELLEEGLRHRINHYKAISSLLRAGLRRIGLNIYVADSISSNTMTTVLLPLGISYDWLYKECKKKGFVIYAALGRLKDKAFRLGVVGCIRQKDIERFLNILDKLLREKAVIV